MATSDNDEDDDLLVGDDLDQAGEGVLPEENPDEQQGPDVGGDYHEDDGGEPEQF